MIELKHVNKSFGNKSVLRDVGFRVEDGETLALIGGSGSGKSTLLRLMIGLDRRTKSPSTRSGCRWVWCSSIRRCSTR